MGNTIIYILVGNHDWRNIDDNKYIHNRIHQWKRFGLAGKVYVFTFLLNLDI